MKPKSIAGIVVWMTTFILLIVPINQQLLALWPSIVAIAIVFLTQKAMVGLIAGATSGMLLLEKGNLPSVFISFFSEHMIPALQSSWNISILIFTLMLGGFVSLIEKGGGIHSLLKFWLKNSGGNQQKLQFTAYGLGLVCFFDGLANSMLVGKSLSGPAKICNVSKAKLAYIVDSTSSAVACVAVISTWIAYQLSMIREGINIAGIEHTLLPFHLYLQSIPYNFYCWFTLILLAVVIGKNWNIGPMKTAEMPSDVSGPKTNVSVQPSDSDSSSSPAKPNTLGIIVPLLVLILGLLFGLYFNGSQGQTTTATPISLESISIAIGNADAALVMLCATALACIVAYIFNYRIIIRNNAQPSEVFTSGVIQLFSPVLILISAWIFSSTLKQLETVQVLGELLGSSLPPAIFPLLVFMLGATISFTTGTSWGTMGVLMPLALPLAIQLDPEFSSPLLQGTIAAVFSGAVFGDHCSPLSDTTIVSSISCGIEPIDHVKTQLPYALIAASLSIAIGFLPVGLGIPVWVSLSLGAATLIALPFLFKPRPS